MSRLNIESRNRLRDQWPRLRDDFERKSLKQSSAIPRSMTISRFHHTSKKHHALQSEDAHTQEPSQNLRSASSLDQMRQSRTKPTLTSLPLSLQARILHHLRGEAWTRRSTLGGTNCFLPSRGPDPNISLDGADNADSILPNELLAPALASPILAAAAQKLLSSACSYLTDISTEMQLPLWVTAFAEHVRAVSVKGIHKGHGVLRRCSESEGMLIDKSCEQAVQLFKALSIDAVRLEVLDLVYVPFHTNGCMQDALLSGLCTTLESNRATLTQLALPIYPYSELLPRALETATLPHLTVLSMKGTVEQEPSTDLDETRTRQFLRMMQAVDGHADRSRHLTTLKELRLIDFDVVPCTDITEYGRSTGFFHTVRTLRVCMSVYYHIFVDWETFDTPAFSKLRSASIADFFVLFSKLESLHWDGTMMKTPKDLYFEKVCVTLKEVHLCYSDWITGAQVGSNQFRHLELSQRNFFRKHLELSKGKIKTLVIPRVPGFLSPARLSSISRCCPNLEYLSLFITTRVVHKLHTLIEGCQRLTGLEVLIAEYADASLGEDVWQQLGKAIPRSHPKLSEIAVQTGLRFDDTQAPIKAVIDCFTEIVKRAGRRAQKLVFRAKLKSRVWSRIWDAICRILDTCTDHSWLLRDLVVQLIPMHRHRIAEDFGILLASHERLRNSKDMAVHSLPYLNKLDLGLMHVWSNEIVASPSRQNIG